VSHACRERGEIRPNDTRGTSSFRLFCKTSPTQPFPIRAVCEKLSLSQLVNLEFLFEGEAERYRDKFWADSWPMMAWSFVNLQNLTTKTEFIGPLIASLKPVPNKNTGATAPWTLLFPHLRQLTLHWAVFAPDELHGEFKECLTMRRENNAHLTLGLYDCCCLFREHVQDLRRIVDVEWDGIEREIDGEYEP
jgi:hypothetical protein